DNNAPKKRFLNEHGPLRNSYPWIIRQITCSDASAIFEVDLDGQKYALKLFHDNGDPGYTQKGRDLNRFRCELNAYKKLSLLVSLARCDYEIALVKGFAEALRDDQAKGLPPNTKFY
ncbi:hypothetical protein N7519_001905, partial [Penicillium mononematosum]|uniref:uncharacterized protein n=1 Tax=Penicillium mononematosum TaxID=268346 RepID=UPI002547D5E6